MEKRSPPEGHRGGGQALSLRPWEAGCRGELSGASERGNHQTRKDTKHEKGRVFLTKGGRMLSVRVFRLEQMEVSRLRPASQASRPASRQTSRVSRQKLSEKVFRCLQDVWWTMSTLSARGCSFSTVILRLPRKVQYHPVYWRNTVLPVFDLGLGTTTVGRYCVGYMALTPVPVCP